MMWRLLSLLPRSKRIKAGWVAGRTQVSRTRSVWDLGARSTGGSSVINVGPALLQRGSLRRLIATAPQSLLTRLQVCQVQEFYSMKFVSMLWALRYIVALFLRNGGVRQAQSGVFGAVIAASLLASDATTGEVVVVEALNVNNGGAHGGARCVYRGGCLLSPFSFNLAQYRLGAGVIQLGWRLGCVGRWEEAVALRQLQPTLTLAWVCAALQLTYRIRYHALDRKVRKIVKNKYRYVRTYVCVREWQRTRMGLRLLPTAVTLLGGMRWEARLLRTLESLIWELDESLLRRLRRQHQQIALAALGLV